MGGGVGSPMGVDLGIIGNVELLLVFSSLFHNSDDFGPGIYYYLHIFNSNS
jgi:hypothetical protein